MIALEKIEIYENFAKAIYILLFSFYPIILVFFEMAENPIFCVGFVLLV